MYNIVGTLLEPFPHPCPEGEAWFYSNVGLVAGLLGRFEAALVAIRRSFPFDGRADCPVCNRSVYPGHIKF